jgi:hypothetical protein
MFILLVALVVAAPPQPAEVDAALARGVEAIVAMQERGTGVGGAPEGPCEWPYEGVYRVGSQIPVGYRIGGTSICALSLLAAPGYADDEKRRDAVRRACEFVCTAIDHPLMNPDYEGGYDVRGWGHAYGLSFLLRLAPPTRPCPAAWRRKSPSEPSSTSRRSRPSRFQKSAAGTTPGVPQRRPSPASPFMTGPALQALFEAKRQGLPVDDAVVERGLKALERCRTASGSYAYAAAKDATDSKDGAPGAVGRMLVGESTLLLAGRSSVPQVRAALDAFIAHWDRLEERRAKDGTHKPPFGVAPYYFYFAHWHAAEALELLPKHERPEYRRRVMELLFRTRSAEGTWNDRVFPRSANYGTACAIMAITAPEGPTPARWETSPATAATPAESSTK